MEHGDDAGHILLHKSLLARGEPVTGALDTPERVNFFKTAYKLYRADWLEWVDRTGNRL